jgi:hypothetical protein
MITNDHSAAAMPAARAMTVARAVAGVYLSAHPRGESAEDRIEGLARLIDAELRRFETPDMVGDEGTPQSVLVAASERFIDRDGYELFVDLLDGTLDVKAYAESAADALRTELSEYRGRGNGVATPE